MKTKILASIFGTCFLLINLVQAQSFDIPDFPDMPNFPSGIPNNATNTNPGGFDFPNFPDTSSTTNTVRVTILKFVNGAPATASSSNNAVFGMSASYSAMNVGSGTGTYALAPSGYNGNTAAYQAITVPLSIGANYSTNELMSTNVGTTCVATSSSLFTPFYLRGYSIGNTMNEAVNANITLATPTLTNIFSNKYIVVWNERCGTSGTGGVGGTVGGPGVLKVDSVETLNANAVADDNFDHGFKYVFNITIPTTEPNLSMRFANWISNSGATILVANNVRISSAQATSTAPVILSSANTYSLPTLNIQGDLDPNVAGRQIKVLVETKVPVNTPVGSYTTTYGIRTQ